jgi:outer membrane protein
VIPFYRIARASALAIAVLGLSVPAKAESIVSALTNAYEYSPQLMSALLSVKSAAETVAQRKAGTRPTIGASASAGTNFSTVIGSGDINHSETASLNLSYRQTLFDSFLTDSQIEQSRALVELSEHALTNQEQNVLLAVVQAYMNVVRDSQLVALRQENVSFFDAQVNSASERLRIGEGTKIDVSQAEARRAQAVAAYRASLSSLQTSQATYQRYVGHKPSGLQASFPYGKLVPHSIDQAVNLAEARNPAILSAKASIRAAQAGADAARSAFGPTLSLIGQVCALCFSQSTGGGGGGGGAAASPFSTSASVQLNLSIPIYSGGALGAGVRKANIEEIKSEVDALATRDQVREAVITAWSTMQNATAQIQSAQSAVSSGQLVLQGVIEERDVGQSTTLDVLNAQAELITAREGLIQAQSSRIIASFALIAATGRLTARDLGLRVAIKSGENYAAKVEDVWQELRALDAD